MSIGERIKNRRIELGWTLRELADRMGYKNHSTVQRVESGKVDIPQSKIEKFSKVLGVPVSYLLGWEEMQKSNDIIADIVVRMRTDEEFFKAVQSIYKMDNQKVKGFLTFLE